MKAEERHRLQENDLQRIADQARMRTRPFFDQYGVALLLGLAAVLIVIAAIVWWTKRSASDRGEGWSALSAAFRAPDRTAENFAAVADAYPESKAAVWARLNEGDERLRSGLESLFSDKEGAVRDLEDAQTAFEAVLDQPGLSDELSVRALYGLARTLEASSSGDLKPAIARYEQIVKQHPGTVYEELAAERIKALGTPEAKDFYAWFAKAKPALQDPLLRPQDRTAPLTPPSGATMPGGAMMPGATTAPDGTATPGGTGGPALPGTTPAGDAAAPAEGAPVEAPRPAATRTPAASDTTGAEPAAPAEPETPAEPAAESATGDGGPSLGGPQ